MICLMNKIKKCACDFFNPRKRRLNKFIKACEASEYAVVFWSNFDDDDILRYFYWKNETFNDVESKGIKICIFYGPINWKEERLWCLGCFDKEQENSICYDPVRGVICIRNEYGNRTDTTTSLDAFLKQLYSIR